MLAMSLLLAVSNPRPSRPRWRSAGRRRSATHPRAGRSAAEDGGGETFLPREEWAKPRGRKSIRPPLRLRRSRRSRPLARSKPLRGPMARVRPTASLGEDLAEHRTERTTGAGFLGPRGKKPERTEGRHDHDRSSD